MMRGSALTLEELLLTGGYVVGYDEADPPKDPPEGEEEEESEEEEDEDESGEEGDDDKTKLQKALASERKQRKDLERANKKLERERKKNADKDLDDVTKARTEAEESKATNVKLAVKLRDTSVDNLITKHAGKLRFRDIDDALKLVDRTKIQVDQDEDDPADIEIEESSVIDALKVLSKDKPHLLLAAGDSEASGGNLGTRGKKDKQELDDEALRKKYPALRRG